MTDQQHRPQPVTRVQLELFHGSGRIAGRIVHTSGNAKPFDGWLELMAALDDAQATDAISREPSSSPEGPHN